MHLGRVLEMAESSDNREAYERKIAERFGDQRELELVVSTPSIVFQQPSEQSPIVAAE